jgi:hypothetical protein
VPKSLLAAVAALALSLGLGAGPAQAHRPDPLAGLAYHPEWGSVTGHPGVLKRGCHTYAFSYTVSPPGDGIWALEVFISGPGFKHVAAGGFLDGYDPMQGTGSYKLCKPTVRYGRFRIEAKVSSDDGSGTIIEGRTATDHYRLHAPHHHR